MSTWVTCPACNLKHSARTDGVCPRCRTTLSPPAPPAATPVPAATAASVALPAAASPSAAPTASPASGRSTAAAVAEPPAAPAAAPSPQRVPAPILPGGAAASWPATAAADDADLVYPNERTLFPLSLAVSIVFWLVLLVGTFGMALFYAPFVFLMYLFTQSALIAYVKGNAIRITERQYPDLHARIVACASRLGMPQVPDCYLLNGHGAFNAFATRFLGRNFVILFSDVVDALEERPGAIDFYVGHELAHVKRGHLAWAPVLLPAGLLPLLGTAYRRACESTCDRHGAACCPDTADAVAAVVALAAGRRRWKTLSFDAYLEQAAESGGFWMSFNELVSDYPWLVKRAARVVAFRDGADLRLPARNPLAYVLAAFVPRAIGGGAGGGLASLLVVVAIVGIVAAIAIPSLLRARVSANEAAAIGDVRRVASAEAAYADQHGRFAPVLPPALAASPARRGYRFALEVDPRGTAFAYTAVPVTAGQTGVRSFCTDGSGVLYASPGDSPVVSSDGTSCRPDLTPLGGL